jgi:hypothetical protein
VYRFYEDRLAADVKRTTIRLYRVRLYIDICMLLLEIQLIDLRR